MCGAGRGGAIGERGDREWCRTANSLTSTSSITICVQMAFRMSVSTPDPSITELSSWRPQRPPKPIMSQTDFRIFSLQSVPLPVFHLSRRHLPSIWFGKLICSACSPRPVSSPYLYLHLFPGTNVISSSLGPHTHSEPPAPTPCSSWNKHFKMQV